MKKDLWCCAVVWILSFCFNHPKWRLVLLAKVRELSIGFWKDRVIMIVRNGGPVWIWSFLRELSLTSKESTISGSPDSHLSNKANKKLKVKVDYVWEIWDAINLWLQHQAQLRWNYTNIRLLKGRACSDGKLASNIKRNEKQQALKILLFG